MTPTPDQEASPWLEQGRPVTIRPLTPDENRLVPALWNAAWSATASGRGVQPESGLSGRGPTRSGQSGADLHGAAQHGAGQHGAAQHGPGHNPYPLSDRLWRERLDSKHHDQSLLLGAFDAGELVGAVYAKVAVSAWQSNDSGWLALLCVAPHRQGSGIGSRLAAAAMRLLRDRGCVVVKLGGEADHLLPGLPQEAGQAAWRLARRLGFLPTTAEHDLLLDLRGLPPAPLPSGLTLRTDRQAAALAFVERSFPGRWAEELASYLAAGATVVTLEQGGDDTAATSAPAQGFCVVFQGGEAVTAPGLLWSEALLTDIGTPGARLGGIGPLGVDPAVRGAGAGLAMVAGAASWLKGRGATDAVINWTTLTSFYGRLGARICRTYQRSTPVSLLRQGATEAPSVSRAAVTNGAGPDNESAARETSA